MCTSRWNVPGTGGYREYAVLARHPVVFSVLGGSQDALLNLEIFRLQVVYVSAQKRMSIGLATQERDK